MQSIQKSQKKVINYGLSSYFLEKLFQIKKYIETHVSNAIFLKLNKLIL